MPTTKITNGARAETRELPMLTLRAAFAPSTFDAEKRTVELVWTTGAKGLRRGWDGEYYEELEVSKSAVRLDRLNNGAPLLAAHNAYSLRGVVGVVERAWLKDGEGRAVVRFSERTDAAETMRDVQSGILQNISVGYAVHKYERIRSVGSDGKPDGGVDTYRAVDWEPMELSIVPIGFDDGAKMRSGEQPKTHTVTIITRRTKMNDETDEQIDNNETGDETIEPATTPAARAAVRAERQRVAGIMKLARIERGNDLDGFAADLIRSGVSLAEARTAFIDERAEHQRRTQPNTRTQHFEFGADYSDPAHIARAIGEAIHARVNPKFKPSEAAAPFVHRSLVEIARECLHLRGKSTRMMSASTIVKTALERGYHGISDFPLALGDAVNRELMRSFQSADAGVSRLARAVTATDFRSHYPIRIGGAPALEVVLEHAEYRRGTIKESSEPAWKLQTWGKMFGLSRHAIINDDLNAFADMPAKFGVLAREAERKEVVKLLTSASGAGPTMGGGNPLFHSVHGNLAGSGSVINVGSLGTARTSMRLQKDLDGDVTNVSPRWLVVPASLETVAQQFLASIDAKTPGDTNPFVGLLELVVDARLDAVSATRWYLVGDQQYGGLELAHLDGGSGPLVETEVGWNVDGIEWKVRNDFGCGFTDYRSWYANPGAAPG